MENFFAIQGLKPSGHLCIFVTVVLWRWYFCPTAEIQDIPIRVLLGL